MNDERIDLDSGPQLHIRQDAEEEGGVGEWFVWMNSMDDGDGICFGSGDTRAEAVAEAVWTLEDALEQLKGKPNEEEVAVKLEELRAAGKLGNEDLRQWLVNHLKHHDINRVARLTRLSRTGLQAYAD